MRRAGLGVSLLLAAGWFVATLSSGFAALVSPQPISGPVPADFLAVCQSRLGSSVLRGGEDPPTGATMLWSGPAQPPGLRVTVGDSVPAEKLQTVMVETTRGPLVTSVYRATLDGYTPLAYSNPDRASIRALFLASLISALEAGLAAVLLTLLVSYKVAPE